jgi:hypothetical protein
MTIGECNCDKQLGAEGESGARWSTYVRLDDDFVAEADVCCVRRDGVATSLEAFPKDKEIER